MRSIGFVRIAFYERNYMNLKATAARNLALLNREITNETLHAEMRRLVDACALHRALRPGWSTVGAR